MSADRRVAPGCHASQTLSVRPLRPGDDLAVRRLLVATAALGRPLRLPTADLRAYAALCLDWYLGAGRADAVVLLDPPRVVGYALLCTDQVAYRHWVRPAAAHWAARALRRLASRDPRVRTFHRLRLLDGMRAAAPHRPPQPAHFHFNIAPEARGGRGGFLLAAHADRRCAALGLAGWWGEVNVPAGKPGRERALRRLGGRVVRRQPNRTLSWLHGAPVWRLTVARSLDPAAGDADTDQQEPRTAA